MPNLSRIIFLLMAIGFLLLPFVPGIEKNTLDLMISLFTVASLASSWNILAGMVGRINLGHVAFFGIGAVTTRELWLTYGWHLAPAFILGAFLAALAALIIGIPALRLKGIYFSVGTLAMAEALRLTISTVLPRISRLPGPELRGYEINPRYFLSLAVLLGILAFFYWLKQSKIGLGMLAIREDEEAAASIGINVLWHTMAAFIASAFFAGLAGGTFAYFHVGYYPSFTFSPAWTFDALLVVFIGGIGTFLGPLLGAGFYVLVRDVLASNLVNFHLIIFGLIFIFVVLVLPGGLVDVFDKLITALRKQQSKSKVERY